MKKVVRDLKRGVNKKVLKVSGIERKVLDATSSEPWGPNGTYLLDIANATRNHQDYQIIMAVIWRRISDTGKKWRHVYKALQLLEYLVAHGSERVIDDIMEHGYQISSLAEFQYIDSSGRDQGINVRRKSQMLVALVNDKEKIQEVRSKAQSNKDKGSYGETGYSGSDYGDDGNHRSGHNKDDERYGRDAAYQDDSYRGQGRNNYNQFSARSPSADGYTDRYGDDDRLSSQSGGGRTDDQSPDNRGHDHSFEAHNSVDALPSYEEAIKKSQETMQDDSMKESVVDPKENLSVNAVAGESVAGEPEASQNSAVDNFDEFDPRGSVTAAQPTASNQELDIFGFSTSDSNNALALVPANSATAQSDATSSFFGADFFAAPSTQQADENPFGDAPFKATPQENNQETSFQHSSTMDGSQKAEPFPTFDFGDAFGASTFVPNATNVNTQQHSSSLTPSFSTPEFPVDNSSNDILDSILPRTGSAPMFTSQDSQFESTSLDPNSAQMNPFQLSNMMNAQSEQMNPFQISPNETNPFQNFGFSASAAQESQGPANTFEMNSFHPPRPLVSHKSLPINAEVSHIASEVSKGLPTDSQPSSEFDFFQSLSHPASRSPTETNSETQIVSVPEAPKGSPANNMQSSSQMSFFQSPSPSASLEPSTNMQVQQNDTQASEMNFFEQSVKSVVLASQEPSDNTQTSQLSSQQSPSDIQSSQMNFFDSPEQSQIASEGSQSNNAESAQTNNLQTAQTNNIQQLPQTNNLLLPPQTNNSMQQPPQANSQQPQQTNNFQQPSQSNYFQQPPQMNNFQQAPQSNNFQQTPQANNFQQPPQTNNFQQPPQANNFQQPPQANNFQQPPQTNNFQQPPQANNFQQLPRMNNFQQPPQISNMQQTPQMNNYQQPPQMSNMQQQLQMSNMQPPPQMSGIQAPQTGNMQTPQNNFFQQRQQYSMPTSQMNFYQQSQGLSSNMQMGQMNYRPFPQGPQIRMQTAQPNFGAPTTPSQSQGMQTHMQTNQTSFVQPTSSSQVTQNALSSNMQAPNVDTQANMQMAQTMQSDPFASQAARPQVQKGKFEPKSTVWADTLSRGLVNLDISGAKTNPLDSIGVDFDAINRRDKRLEPKSSGPPPASTIVMGKAMGSGSGIGRSAASAIAPLPSPMMGPNNMGMGPMGGPMGMGMRGPGMGMGMGMGGYGGGNMNQAPMGMGMGMNMGMMGPSQGMMQQGGGGYNNPMMGGYNSQHPPPPYGPGGGGYR